MSKEGKEGMAFSLILARPPEAGKLRGFCLLIIIYLLSDYRQNKPLKCHILFFF